MPALISYALLFGVFAPLVFGGLDKANLTILARSPPPRPPIGSLPNGFPGQGAEYMLRYAQEGFSNYWAWMHKTTSDIPFPSKLGKTMVTTRTNGHSLAGGTPALLVRGSEDAIGPYTSVTSYWPKSQPDGRYDAHFVSWISVEHGIFIMFRRVMGVGEGQRRIPQPYSQIAWWTWVKTIQKSTPSIKRLGWNSYSGMKWFWFQDVGRQDVDTQSVLSRVHQELGSQGRWDHTHPTILPLVNESPDNFFWIIVGSPYVASLQAMLTENKSAMDNKCIVALAISSFFVIEAPVRNRTGYHLGARLERCTAPEPR